MEEGGCPITCTNALHLITSFSSVDCQLHDCLTVLPHSGVLDFECEPPSPTPTPTSTLHPPDVKSFSLLLLLCECKLKNQNW